MATEEPIPVEPKSISLGDATIHVFFRKADHEWRVEVVLVRAADQARVAAEDLTVELIGKDGELFEVRDRPSGDLVEVGGSLGISASGIFRFTSSAGIPAKVAVSYRERKAAFRIHPMGNNP